MDIIHFQFKCHINIIQARPTNFLVFTLFVFDISSESIMVKSQVLLAALQLDIDRRCYQCDFRNIVFKLNRVSFCICFYK